MALFFIIIIVAVILVAIVFSVEESNKQKEFASLMEEYRTRLDKIKGFTASEIIEGQCSLFLFAIDDRNDKIVYIDRDNTSCVDYNSIISVELLEEGTVTQKKSTSRTIGGALLGGAMIGGVGAIIGGVTGSSKERKNVSSVVIKILLRDIKCSTLLILCFDAFKMTNSNELKLGSSKSYLYHKGIEQANKLKDLISVIIDKVDSREKIQQSDIRRNDTYRNISDELEKLYNLKEKGIITTEEFNSQKRKLLSE